MRYLSPTTLMGRGLTGPPDSKALQLQRKKLLAELELSTDGQLTINDHAFGKNDILEYFETLHDENVLLYHEAVSEDPALTGFLERGVLPQGAAFAHPDLYSDVAFLEWISPYFYTAFTEYVYRSLENTDEPALQTMMQNPLLLTEYSREHAWVRIAQMLHDNITALQQYAEPGENGPALSIDDISVLITDTLTRMILLFPTGPFKAVRDEYAFYIRQVCIHIFNNEKHHRDYIDPWMKNARALAVSEELAAEVTSNLEEMNTLRAKSRNRWLRRFPFILVFILLKFMFNQHSTSDNHYPVPATVIYNGDTIHAVNQLDSLMHPHRPQDTGFHLRSH